MAAAVKRWDYMVSLAFLLTLNLLWMYMYFVHAPVCKDISMVTEAMLYVVTWHELWCYICYNLSKYSHNVYCY